MTTVTLMTMEELKTVEKAGNLLLEFAEIDDTDLWEDAHRIGEKILKFLESYTEKVSNTIPEIETVADYPVSKC